jgi:peptidoglycan/LPS O-acetylase OafA/YrhL
MPTSPSSKYRPEIDGLRAFAVVAVIINHFNKDLLPGGYLGIDIFFVISGYVITSSLAGRESKNFLDFVTGFYERRIKRLMPVLVVFVLITSILISLFNPDPSVSLGYGWKSLFGVSNISLYRRSTDYFAQSTELNPFTHTWSLGVEEQFYLLFPFLIWFSGFGQQTSKGPRNLFFLIGTLTIASLIGFIYLYQVNQPAAYFLMPPRFWEMAAGCLLFIGFQKRARIEQSLEQVPPLLVVAAMVGVMYLPVAAAVPATIGMVVLTTVLIACLKKGTIAYKFFTLENVVYVGLISYSLYLWHWTVLSISRWTVGIHWWSAPIQVALIIALATASYNFIEIKTRKKAWHKNRFITLSIGISLAAIPAASIFALARAPENFLYTGSKEFKEPSFNDRFNNIAITHEKCFVFKDVSSAIQDCVEHGTNQRSSKTVWLLGDSHAMVLLNGIRRVARNNQATLRVVTRAATAFPQPQNYFKLNKYDKKNGMLSARLIRQLNTELLRQVSKGDIVIIAQRFMFHFGPDTFENWEEDFAYVSNEGKSIDGSKRKFFGDWLNETDNLGMLLKSKGASLIIMGPVPEWENGKAFCIKQWYNLSSCRQLRTDQDKLHQQSLEDLTKLAQKHSNLYIFNTNEVLCPLNICRFQDPEGRNLYLDDDHISDYASFNLVAPVLSKFIDAKVGQQ